MIIDKWENSSSYFSLHPLMEKGVRFANTLLDLPAGRYEHEQGIFALVQTGKTTDISSSPMECHRRFLDIQIVVDGKEMMMCEELKDTKEHIPYDSERDVELRMGEGHRFLVSKGEFYLMFPHDCHKCCGNNEDGQSAYRKIVLKLPIS